MPMQALKRLGAGARDDHAHLDGLSFGQGGDVQEAAAVAEADRDEVDADLLSSDTRRCSDTRYEGRAYPPTIALEFVQGGVQCDCGVHLPVVHA